MTASTTPDLNQVAALRRRVIDPALGEVRRKPATAVRGEEHEEHRRLASLGRAGTTQQSPVNHETG